MKWKRVWEIARNAKQWKKICRSKGQTQLCNLSMVTAIACNAHGGDRNHHGIQE